MKRFWQAVLAAAGCVVPAAPADAAFVVYGTPGTVQTNSFPFGGVLGGGPSTRYQQVYNEARFPDEPVVITAITFFRLSPSNPGGDWRTGTYDFFLSTTPRPVNGLDTTNLNANPGPDARLFTSVFLSGPAPDIGSVATFTGTPFAYDPSAGNLLLDIRYTGSGEFTRLFFDAQNGGTFGDDSSRASNYGGGFASGLVTRFDFEPAAAVPAPPGAVLGLVGAAGLGWLRRRRAV